MTNDEAIAELNHYIHSDSLTEAPSNEACQLAIDALKRQWISVEERLPEEEENVLVVRKFLGVNGVPPSIYVEIANRIGEDWFADSDEYKIARSKHTDPLYWMPLPEPPKEV